MAFNQDTYAHDLLTLVGGRNIFADCWENTSKAIKQEKGSDITMSNKVRYPCITLEDVLNAQPDLVLLPNEPYAFGVEHRQELRDLLADTPAGRSDQFHLVDGSLGTWHGTRIGRAIKELPPIFNNINP